MEEGPTPDLDSGALLRSAARWLGEAQDAVAKSQWAQANTALKLAETMYLSGSELSLQIAEDDAQAMEMLAEGRALCTLLRSDIALRHWQLNEAETHLDAAYKVLKLGEGLGVELWRLTARLAERRGRWTSAYAAWKKVAKTLDGKDEFALADAWIRLAEISLIEGKSSRAQEYLLQVEPLSRELDSRFLQARVTTLRAAELEATQEFDAAFDVYVDAEAQADDAPKDFLGLLKLRMAGTLVHRNPRKAMRRLEQGLADLVEARHPDAYGLALSQIAILALILKRPAVAGLAAMSAERTRGGRDGSSRPVLSAALEQLEATEAAQEVLDLEVDVTRHQGVARALDPTVQRLKMNWDDIGKPESVPILSRVLQNIQSGRIQVRVEDAIVLTDANALFKQRATLTWDAPQGRLVTRAPPPPPLPTVPKLIAATAPVAPVRKMQERPAPSRSNAGVQLASVSLGLVFMVTLAFALGTVITAIILRTLGY